MPIYEILKQKKLMPQDNQFYILKPAVGTKETGMAYPAVESYDDYDFNGPNSVHKIKFNEFPDFDPDIRFKLAKGAKLCDMMGQATINAHGFIISEKLKLILEQANTVTCKFYPAPIEDKGMIHKYYWVHFVWEDAKKLIDYEGSKFFKRKFSNNLGYLDIKSEDDLNVTLAEYQGRYMIGFELIKIKEQPSFDLMVVPFNIDIIVSESLKLLLEQCSGLLFEKLIYVEFKDLNLDH